MGARLCQLSGSGLFWFYHWIFPSARRQAIYRLSGLMQHKLIMLSFWRSKAYNKNRFDRAKIIGSSGLCGPSGSSEGRICSFQFSSSFWRQPAFLGFWSHPSDLCFLLPRWFWPFCIPLIKTPGEFPLWCSGLRIQLLWFWSLQRHRVDLQPSAGGPSIAAVQISK